MSDLESVDLSQESEGEVVEETQILDEPPSPAKPSRLSKSGVAPPTPQRSSPRGIGAKPGSNAQNGAAIARKRKEIPVTEVPPGRPAAASKIPNPTRKTTSYKPAEKAPEKLAELPIEVPKTAPPKAKRGRPKKTHPKPKTNAIADPGASTKANPTANPTAPSVPAPTVPASASKQGSASKPGPGESPRPANRGRKKRLPAKAVEATQTQNGHDKEPEAAIPESQEPPASENGALPQKQVSKPPEKKSSGVAAKQAASKRKRVEDEDVTLAAPAGRKTIRGLTKKGGGGSTPNSTEVPAPPPPRARPTKRTKRQQTKEVPPPIPNEVIRIEDDVSSAEEAVPLASTDGPSGKDAQMKDKPSQPGADARHAAPENAAPAVGRQSLPPSFSRLAGRRRKAKEVVTRSAANKAGPVHGQVSGHAEQVLAETDGDISAPTQKDKVTPLNNARKKRSPAVRHSTGNIVPMDTDKMDDVDQNENQNQVPHSEAVTSLLDEVQRNAIPFLFAQDSICDKFSSRMGQEVDVILRNSKEDVFQVFSDQVKDALISDRIRLAIGSAKTDLRRGIERLLREFARRVAAPLADTESTLLLRNEVPRTRSVKEERRTSRAHHASSPRISTPLPSSSARVAKQIASGRIAEDSYMQEERSDKDDLSDAAEPLVRTPNRQLGCEPPSLSNAADLKKFVGYSYENLNLGCYRSAALLKLCSQPGGKTFSQLHDITPLGKNMIRNKLKDLMEHGYVVEDDVEENNKILTIYSTAAHVTED